jgi:hypothetical protein
MSYAAALKFSKSVALSKLINLKKKENKLISFNFELNRIKLNYIEFPHIPSTPPPLPFGKSQHIPCKSGAPPSPDWPRP